MAARQTSRLSLVVQTDAVGVMAALLTERTTEVPPERSDGGPTKPQELSSPKR
ncbi:MAG: hypothetical protein KatS3mg060_0316 [Dehalococcoidia bacterium]|nr:MAG: hypothetical protein KatS3mg060_0316 [Dehalococcoidia bacterium]